MILAPHAGAPILAHGPCDGRALLVLVVTVALMGRMVFSCSWAVYFTDCAARYPPAQWIEQCGAIPWDDDYINDKCHMWRCKSSACSARASSPLLFSPLPLLPCSPNLERAAARRQRPCADLGQRGEGWRGA